jgi:hypothetical protein
MAITKILVIDDHPLIQEARTTSSPVRDILAYTGQPTTPPRCRGEPHVEWLLWQRATGCADCGSRQSTHSSQSMFSIAAIQRWGSAAPYRGVRAGNNPKIRLLNHVVRAQ